MSGLGPSSQTPGNHLTVSRWFDLFQKAAELESHSTQVFQTDFFRVALGLEGFLRVFIFYFYFFAHFKMGPLISF